MQQVHREAWQRLAGRADTDDLTGIEDSLAPWQTCDFASGTAREWHRFPDSVRRRMGWPPDLSLPSRTRLTISVQTAPSWNPETAPPGLVATNAELFPPCYFTIAAGSGGCRMAAQFWRAVCGEHGIDARNGKPLHDAPGGSWRGFFREERSKVAPHAVFAGLDSDESKCLQGGLFSKRGILCGPGGATMAEQTLRFMQEHSRDAGSPAGVLLFASLEGGNASLLGSLLLERLRTRYPAVPLLAIGVLPLGGVSPVVTAPLHIALAMQSIRRHANAALLFSNEMLLEHAARVWQMPEPGYAEANRLIAGCLCALTGPLRFGGTDKPPADLATLIGCMTPAGSISAPEVSAQFWPLAALADRRRSSLALPWLVRRAVSVATRGNGGADDKAMFVSLRVRTRPEPEFVTSSEPPVVSLSGRIDPAVHESAAVFAPSPAIARALRRISRQATAFCRLDNARVACHELGIPLEHAREAIRELAADSHSS